jgi:glycerol-3-phosphate dehydrogenase subunit B
LDLLAIYPIGEKKFWNNPWKALDTLRAKSPRHPYSKIQNQTMRAAFTELLRFFTNAGCGYRFKEHQNCLLPTAQGTIKPTYLVPVSMWNGVAAFAEKQSCLLIDFRGLKEFSACQVHQNLKENWPGLRSIQLEFPGMENLAEIHPEQMARSLENKLNCERLIQLIKPHLKQETAIGLPAVLGIHKTASIMATMEDELGVSLFEIPTPAVSVSGLRIKEVFERHLSQNKVFQLRNSRVEKVEQSEGGTFILHVTCQQKIESIAARAIILASGRFLGGGLSANRQTICEPLFGLPVRQPASRTQWHQPDFFNSKGHPVNRAGLEVDEFFRPLANNHKPLFENLFAAGSILAHQDWIREKSGSGIAVTSAYAAVQSLVKEGRP